MPRKSKRATISSFKAMWVTPKITRRDWYRFGLLLTDKTSLTPLQFLSMDEERVRDLADVWHRYREREIAEDVCEEGKDGAPRWPDEGSSFRTESEVQAWFVELWEGARGLSSPDPEERSEADDRLLSALVEFRDRSTLSSWVQWTALRRWIADTALLQSDRALMRFIEALQATLPRVSRCHRCGKIYLPQKSTKRGRFCGANCRKRHGEERKPRVRTQSK
ncbi:MAG: hypothetical protein ABFE07_18495 [Armatimonadia bacterium]